MRRGAASALLLAMAEIFRNERCVLIGRARLVVDLKQIIYISSAGFRALLVAGRLADETKGTLALCGLSAELQRLFDLGAFTDLFTIYASRDESVAKLT